jgi:hypothetical protein
MHYLLILEKLKIYTKIHKKYRSYTFRSTTIFRELVLNLAKVVYIKTLGKITSLYVI